MKVWCSQCRHYCDELVSEYIVVKEEGVDQPFCMTCSYEAEFREEKP